MSKFRITFTQIVKELCEVECEGESFDEARDNFLLGISENGYEVIETLDFDDLTITKIEEVES